MVRMTETEQPARWWQQAAWIKRHWPLRTTGTLLFMLGFFAVYFWLLRHPMFPVTLMPVTRLDRWITFQPWSIVLYASLWVYVSLPPMLLRPWRELLIYASTAMLVSMAGFAMFFFWPTAVPQPDIDWVRYPSVAFLKSVDASGNACPSLHVAFCVLTCLWLERWFRDVQAPAWPRLINVAWCLAIVYSTMATKQHVALDVAAGAGLGLLVTTAHLYCLRAWPLPPCELECN